VIVVLWNMSNERWKFDINNHIRYHLHCGKPALKRFSWNVLSFSCCRVYLMLSKLIGLFIEIYTDIITNMFIKMLVIKELYLIYSNFYHKINGSLTLFPFFRQRFEHNPGAQCWDISLHNIWAEWEGSCHSFQPHLQAWRPSTVE